MPGKLNVYNLGELGVNTTVSPVHLKDGELTKGQNATYDPSGGEGGLRKRFGMTKLNGTAAAGVIGGLISVPLPNPQTLVKTLYAGYGSADANTWTKTTDGAVYTPGTTPASPIAVAKLPTGAYYFERAATLNGKLYYPGDNYTLTTDAPILCAYDGTLDLEVLKVPYSAAASANANNILDMTVVNGMLAFSVYDTGGSAPNHRGRVFMFMPSIGYLYQIGNRFGGASDDNTGGMPFTLCSYGGKLWAGTYGVSGAAQGKIYWIRPLTDDAWTLDFTAASGQGWIMSLCGYRGQLYAGTSGDAGSSPLVKVRSSAGVWTTSDTGGGITGTNGYYCSLIVFEDNLFACYYDLGGAGNVLIRKYNGSSWSTDLNVKTTYSAREPGQAFVFNGNLYVSFVGSAQCANADGFILKKAGNGSGTGSWTQPVSSINTRGYLAQTIEIT